jgi:hypothetical protein
MGKNKNDQRILKFKVNHDFDVAIFSEYRCLFPSDKLLYLALN